MRQAPNLEQVSQRFAVNRANATEVIWNPLYDFQTYANAGTTTAYQFFQTPVGQSSKTLVDTNMDSAGILAAPQKFLITGIEVLFWSGVQPGTTGLIADTGEHWDDVWTMFKGGVLRLKIGAKDYVIDGPLGMFPCSSYLTGVAALGGVGAAAGSNDQIQYAAFCGRPYEPVPMFIPPAQNFKVSLEFPTTTALPSGTDGRIGVRLLGYLYRLSQ